MENARRTTGLLVLFATSMMTATVATSQQARATTEDPRPAAETRWARCLLRIVGQSNVISFSDDIVRRFVYGDDARLRVIKDVLGPISETAFGGSSRFVEIRTLERQASEASNEISLLLSLEVCLPSGVKPAAEEF
ncbi:MAG: hypothetical protein GX448_06275, partial [Planctomycetes bacterium]|nr:hypothetical protein [Planctomycetota bacterium]